MGGGIAAVRRGQLRYLASVEETLTTGIYPFQAPLAEGWGVTSFEFLDPTTHPVYALRPPDPLQVTWGFYSPEASFCYPRGEGPWESSPKTRCTSRITSEGGSPSQQNYVQPRGRGETTDIAAVGRWGGAWFS